MKKFHLRCRTCKHIINDFSEWFGHKQSCPKCGQKWVDVEYFSDISTMKKLLVEKKPENLFHYFDFLPLNSRENIVSDGEGVIPVERWKFLEKFAKDFHDIDIQVSVYRNDLNPGTGTFKDVAAALVASVLKENGVKQYAVASTGNIANAFAHYLALAGISLSVFIPQDALVANEAGVGSYGQTVYRVKGDYHRAKVLADEYSQKYNILLSGGNIDPMRVEAKKTMVFEWIRQTGGLPDLYIQALSGGTGPIAIEKGCQEIKNLGLIKKTPRYILVQPSGCDPMSVGWQRAKDSRFKSGWEQDFPIYEAPVTKVPTLATGNPFTFPIIANIVKASKGEILTFNEDDIFDVVRLIAFETAVKIGPAATIAVGGFFEALKQKHIKNGEKVLINAGEGIRRAPEILDEMRYTTRYIDSVNETSPDFRDKHRDSLWKKFVEKYS